MNEESLLEVLVKNNESIENKESYLYEIDNKDKTEEIVKYERIENTWIDLSLFDIKLKDDISYAENYEPDKKLKKNKSKINDIEAPLDNSASAIIGTGKFTELLEQKMFSFFGQNEFQKEINVAIVPAINYVPHALLRAYKSSGVNITFLVDKDKFQDLSKKFFSKNIDKISVSFEIKENSEGVYSPYSAIPHPEGADSRIKFLDSIDDVKNKNDLPSNFKAGHRIHTTDFNITTTSYYVDNKKRNNNYEDEKLKFNKKEESDSDTVKALKKQNEIKNYILLAVFLCILYVVFN